MKRSFQSVSYIALVMILTLLLNSCNDAAQQTSVTVSTATPAPNIYDEAYFPMESGRQWDYKITLGKATPMQFTHVHLSGPGIPLAVYVLINQILAKPDGAYGLSLKIEKVLAPGSVEVKIINDDLLIFPQYETLIWRKESNPDFSHITEYAKYTRDLLTLWNYKYDRATGTRVIFIWGKGRIIIEDADDLDCEGIDYHVPGYDGFPSLHCKRTIYGKKDKVPY